MFEKCPGYFENDVLVYKQVDFSNNLTSKLLSRRKNHEFKKSGNA